MTKISQIKRYPGAGVDRNQRRQNLIDLAAAQKVRQAQEAKGRDQKRKLAARNERNGLA